MSDLKFFTNPRSRGRITRWMLHEVGADYEPVYLQYDGSLGGPEYARINPMKKLPAIQHGDAVVTEVAAICAYLADAFPDAGMAPPLDQRADYYRWLFFAAGPLEAAITNAALGVQPSAEQQAFVGYGEMGRVLDTLEAKLNSSPYVCGDRFSAADVYLGSQIGFGLQFNTIEKREAFEDYAKRTSDRDAWREANRLDDEAAAESA